MMDRATPGFIYGAAPARVVFGTGRVHALADELERLGAGRALVACTGGGATRYRAIIDALGPRCVRVFARAEPHCPEPIALAALAEFAARGADAVVTIGGGSTIGLGKVIAARRKVPFVAIPTTLSGSEMTALYGMKIGQEKRTWTDAAARARTVIYDPDLTATLPGYETATTGMNCLAHCVEALYPAEPNPIARLIALEGLRTLATSLPGVTERNDGGARAGALYSGFIGGLLVSMVGIGLHHKICHVLGGHFDVPHGASNSVILPHVVAFNAPAMPEIAADIADALGCNDPAAGIFDLAARIGAPQSLRQFDVPQSKLRAVAEQVVARGTHNPRPINAENISALLVDAWEGRRPASTSERRGAPAVPTTNKQRLGGADAGRAINPS
jgi:maleylacetate reductase